MGCAMSDELHINKAHVYLEEALKKIALAVSEIESSHTLTVGEENTLSIKMAMIYNELRNVHQEIAKKRA
jgi:hypothetical protein